MSCIECHKTLTNDDAYGHDCEFKRFDIEVFKWFDKINGNAYHAVNIYEFKEGWNLIYSSGLTYGYGEQYKETAKDWLIKNGYLDVKDRFNHELLRNLINWNVKNALKRDLKKIGVKQ